MTAADGALFVDHRVVLTPVEETNRYATQRVRRLWEIAGADVVEMDAMEHDRLLAMTSHLPHAVAFALVHSWASNKMQKNSSHWQRGVLRPYSGGLQ
ncbi:MAG: hypothetical protein CM1200mP41_26570 [Gammaproteobacteria bacterium]|nr:MAG: hypothetical protein CM1200mP41_26570 [Gammaproteobacteria bacterium]